jgi:hypothetical protein
MYIIWICNEETAIIVTIFYVAIDTTIDIVDLLFYDVLWRFMILFYWILWKIKIFLIHILLKPLHGQTLSVHHILSECNL